MLNIELTQEQVRSLKWQVASFYRHAKDFNGSLAKAVHYLSTNIGFDDIEGYSFVALGVISGYGYERGNPAGGSFLTNWRRFLTEHVTMVAPPPAPARPDPSRPVVEVQYKNGADTFYKVAGFDCLINFRLTPRDIVAMMRVSPEQGALLFIDTSVKVDSLDFWALVDRARLYLADWETTSKVEKDYNFYR